MLDTYGAAWQARRALAMRGIVWTAMRSNEAHVALPDGDAMRAGGAYAAYDQISDGEHSPFKGLRHTVAPHNGWP